MVLTSQARTIGRRASFAATSSGNYQEAKKVFRIKKNINNPCNKPMVFKSKNLPTGDVMKTKMPK